jgi:hypothetical protein
MDRPKIEEFLELCEKKTPGEWKAENKHGLIEGEIWITATEKGGDCNDRFSIAAVRRGCDEAGGEIENCNDAAFIAAAGTDAQSIAKYAIGQEQKAALMEKAFDILAKERVEGFSCNDCSFYSSCTKESPDCKQFEQVKNYWLSEAERQLKEDHNDKLG